MPEEGPSILTPPGWLCEHAEIKRRGIELELVLKPVSGCSTSLLPSLTIIIVLRVAYRPQIDPTLCSQSGAS